MAEFKAIETQEELDSLIGARLERERKAYERKYGGFEEYREKAAKYDEILGRDYEGQIRSLKEKHEEETGELRARLARAEEGLSRAAEAEARAEKAEKDLLRMRVAAELNVPGELAGRIAGDTEEEMRKDAEGLSRFAAPAGPAPLFSPETHPGRSSADMAFARMSAELAGK